VLRGSRVRISKALGVGRTKPIKSGCHRCTQSAARCTAELSLRRKRTLDTARIVTNVTTPATAKTETAPSSSPETTPSSSQETTPSSAQLDDETVIKKAKATIAAKVSDPNSVEFQGMERAARKNALGNSIATICGFVRDKNSGPRPFLYIVEKDEAYIGGYAIATSSYRNICSITTLPDR
jgi:hypothetical protein